MSDNETFDDLPPSLVDELKAADRPVPMITARVDREVAAMARAQFAARRRRARLRPAGLAAIAASVLVAVLVVQLQAPAPDDSSLYGDIDRSGRIDIADVLAAARTRKASAPELDAFAYRIVALEPSGDAS